MCVMACISRMTIHMMTMTTSSHRIPKIPTITITMAMEACISLIERIRI